MKNSSFIILLLSIALVFVSYKWITASQASPAETSQDEAAATATVGNEPSATPDENGFVEFDVTREWSDNPFDFFRGHGLLLASGNREKSNAMTIGWGALGNIWQRDASTVTVYVAEGRYTYKFLESSNYFTVMAFDEEHNNVLDYMGTHSGRDEDKAEVLGLHTLYTDNGTPYYAEATMVLECEILYRFKFMTEGMHPDIAKFYEGFSAGVHHQYIGKIVKAIRKAS